MASRQPLGYCCTAESAKPWTAITSTPMYGRPRYGRPRLPQAGSSRPEPTACTPCGISTSRYCWMRARASRRSRSISGTATPASRCGPTPTCCRPANSEQGRPSTAPSREWSNGRRPAHGPGGQLTTISAGQPPGTLRCRSRGGTEPGCPAQSYPIHFSPANAAGQGVLRACHPAASGSDRPGSVRLLAKLLADPRIRGPPHGLCHLSGAARDCNAPAPWDTGEHASHGHR
jgi:hypothetical protein